MNSKNQSIIILGMHRSGTSCLAGILQYAGIPAGIISTFNQDNQYGNRENKELLKLNIDLLSYNDRSWSNPPTKDIQLKASKELINRQDILLDKLNKQSSIWMIKEPRLVITLPFWEAKFPSPHYIGTFRDPLKVAMSLWTRNPRKIKLILGLKLWLYYNRLIIEKYNKRPFPIVCFDLIPNEYINDVRKKTTSLSTKTNIGKHLNIEEGLHFFNKSLIHQLNFKVFEDGNLLDKESQILLEECKEVYQILLELANVNIKDLSQPNNYFFVPISKQDDTELNTKILKIQPNNSYVCHMQAIAFENQKKYQQAIEYYIKATENNSNLYSSITNLATLYKKNNQLYEAKSLYQTAIKNTPNITQYYLDLSNIHLLLNDKEAALEILENGLKNNYYSLAINSRLVVLLFDNDRTQDGLTIIKKLSSQFDYKDIWYKIGQDGLKKNSIKATRIAFDTLYDLSYENLSSLSIKLGNIYLQKEAFEEAENCFLKTLEVDPSNKIALHRVAVVYFKKKEYDQSIKYNSKAIEIDKNFYQSYLLRARCYNALKENDNVHLDLEKAISIDSNNFRAYALYGNLYFRKKEFNTAIKMYKKVIELNPPNKIHFENKLDHINKLQKK